jgi:hypothetical protein
MTATKRSAEDPTPIAIIGMACMFSQAPDLQAFWNNILGRVDAIGEPVLSWDAQRYLESGRIKTQFGGYLRELYRFDPREFGIMPNSMDGGEPDQFLALRVAHDALADAGYDSAQADHSETGIILGHSTYLHRGQVTVIQHNVVLDQTMALLEAALPHLDELGTPATIFLPTDVISGTATYHWYETPPPALTWDDARAAAAGGVVVFEAHGTTHRSLPALSDDELRAELVGSKETIERELGGPVRVFCYPAGRHGDREARMAQEVGYAAAVTTQPGVNVPGTDPFRLRRTTIAWSDSVRTFERKLLGALDTLSGVERWVRARRSRA